MTVHLDKKIIKEETLTISETDSQKNIAWFSQYLPADKRNVQNIEVFPYPKEGVKIKSKNYYIRIAYVK